MKKDYSKPTVKSNPIQPGDIEAGARFAQKRSAPRYPFSARTVVTEPLTRTKFMSRTSDISIKGCYLESLDQLPRNTVIRISIEHAGESFETWGRVAHVQARSGTGISFFDTSVEQLRTIVEWVAQISGFLDSDQR
ncbi:MAG: PilZ domain-containing protein [Candidatus Acidiferrales bacterium]